jgi:hypothetical protein
MKSDLFEALEMLRAWYLDEQWQSNKEMDIISEALKDGRCIRREANKIANENRSLPVYLYQKEYDCIILLYSLCYVLSKFLQLDF